MSDAFYRIVRCVGKPAFVLSSAPTVLHADRLKGKEPVLIAPNHLSPYDIPCLMASTPRLLDFVSIVEVFRNRLSAWFLGNMNAFPLDRGRRDPATTRRILDRLAKGRTVVMFPEGQIRDADRSLLAGGDFKPSVVRLARLANVPIVPCVLLGTGAFGRAKAWLPLRRTRYAILFGQRLTVARTDDETVDCAEALLRLRQAYDRGYAELRLGSGMTVNDSPWRSPRI